MTTKKDKLNAIFGLILFLLILIGGMLDTQILEEQKTKEIINYADTVEVFLNDSIVIFNWIIMDINKQIKNNVATVQTVNYYKDIKKLALNSTN